MAERTSGASGHNGACRTGSKDASLQRHVRGKVGSNGVPTIFARARAAPPINQTGSRGRGKHKSQASGNNCICKHWKFTDRKKRVGAPG